MVSGGLASHPPGGVSSSGIELTTLKKTNEQQKKLLDDLRSKLEKTEKVSTCPDARDDFD